MHFGPQSEGRKFTGAITGAKVEERADKDETEISGVTGLYLQDSLIFISEELRYKTAFLI